MALHHACPVRVGGVGRVGRLAADCSRVEKHLRNSSRHHLHLEKAAASVQRQYTMAQRQPLAGWLAGWHMLAHLGTQQRCTASRFGEPLHRRTDGQIGRQSVGSNIRQWHHDYSVSSTRNTWKCCHPAGDKKLRMPRNSCHAQTTTSCTHACPTGSQQCSTNQTRG